MNAHADMKEAFMCSENMISTQKQEHKNDIQEINPMSLINYTSEKASS